ncbi:hypothetical protein PPROV_000727300 [Pycnococcus provasolii]|uniref:Uncharacterized protein n=1 Tax=Pycnococcus provasolii TaxID=41880 RepID=A0A830HPE4_9CHLO|nr:hypothetical protein PPROV_000727300 [Pycnococcus provasolii]
MNLQALLTLLFGVVGMVLTLGALGLTATTPCDALLLPGRYYYGGGYYGGWWGGGRSTTNIIMAPPPPPPPPPAPPVFLDSTMPGVGAVAVTNSPGGAVITTQADLAAQGLGIVG